MLRKSFKSIRLLKRAQNHMSFSGLREIEQVMPVREKVTIGSYLATRLAQAGANHYFTVPGDFTLSLLDEFLKNDSLTMIGCCNELNAGYAADGYARATGGLGVVMVTYMVGGLSVINAIAGAYSDNLPVICVSGGPNTKDSQEHHLIHHTIGEHNLYQQSACFKPIVKETFVIRHPDDAAQMIDTAIYTAIKHRKPVYLEVPVNLSLYEIDPPMPTQDLENFERFPSDPVSLDLCVQDILSSINAAVRPVLIAGSKLRKADAEDEFLRLAEAMNCGTAIMPDAKGLFPEDHDTFIGRYWASVSSPRTAELVESSDLIIMAGPVINDYTTTGWNALLNKKKRIILSTDYVEMGGTRFSHVWMKEVLDRLADQAPEKTATLSAYKRYAESIVKDDVGDVDSSEPLNLRYLTHAVEESLTENSTLMVETGDSWFIGQNMTLPTGAKFMVQMQYGSIGWSVGALLGVALAEGNDRKVIALIGDGSFQVTAQELSTLIREKANCTLVLLNNKGYTIEVQIHDGAYNDIKNWDYKGLVDTFNAEDGTGLGLKATTCGEFAEALEQAEAHDGLALIECTLERDDCTAELLEWGSRVARANGRI